MSLLLEFKLTSLYSPIEQIPPELLLFKTIGTVLVLLDEKGFVVDVLALLWVCLVHSPVNETITASSQTNLSPKNIKRYEEVSLKPQLQPFLFFITFFTFFIPTHSCTYTVRTVRTFVRTCMYLLGFMLPSFRTNLSQKILLSVKQLHEERRTAEVEKCK